MPVEQHTVKGTRLASSGVEGMENLGSWTGDQSYLPRKWQQSDHVPKTWRVSSDVMVYFVPRRKPDSVMSRLWHGSLPLPTFTVKTAGRKECGPARAEGRNVPVWQGRDLNCVNTEIKMRTK